MRSVIFIGPLPPPIHGFSFVNACMLSRLERRAPVFLLQRGNITSLKLLYSLRGLFGGRFVSAYIGLSGGYGQVIDCFLVLCLRLFRVPVYLHHHSFNYINEASRFSLLIFYLLRKCNHIALCERMASGLMRNYRISGANIKILSNACFLPLPAAVKERGSISLVGSGLRVGFLSNITEEKGIFDFLEVMQVLMAARLPVQAYVAGPVDESISGRFFSQLAEMSSVSYLGPVYNEDKQRFYENIDVLVFPTKYVNEAEPVTLLEAMSHGLLVISRARGCIRGMTEGIGYVFSDENFVDQTVDLLRRLSTGQESYDASKVRSAFESLHQQSGRVLSQLLLTLTGREMPRD